MKDIKKELPAIVFCLNDVQTKTFVKWSEKLEKKLYKNKGAMDVKGAYTFSFTPTGIGEAVEVSHPCGEKLNLSEYEKW